MVCTSPQPQGKLLKPPTGGDRAEVQSVPLADPTQHQEVQGMTSFWGLQKGEESSTDTPPGLRPPLAPSLHFLCYYHMYLLYERGEGRERNLAPDWGRSLQPSMCPDWESNLRLSGSQARAPSTEPHQPGSNAQPLKSLTAQVHASLPCLPQALPRPSSPSSEHLLNPPGSPGDSQLEWSGRQQLVQGCAPTLSPWLHFSASEPRSHCP